MDCRLCSPELSSSLGESRSWRWVLHPDQDPPGRSMLVPRRHVGRVTELSESTWEELHRFLQQVIRRTDEVLEAARVDLSFHVDADSHLHLALDPVDSRGAPAAAGDLAGRLRLPPPDPDATVYEHFLPPRRMRPTALCVLSRGGEILVGEGRDPASGTTFLRPPGGEIEFGEHSRAAVVREVREELGIDLIDVHRLGVLEEVYTHRGRPGHEVAFVFDGRATDDAVYDREELTIREEVGAPTRAFWATPAELRADERLVVPPGLLELAEEHLPAHR